MLNIFIFLIVLIFSSGTAIAGGEKCPNINLPCSCDDAKVVYLQGLNNDPYRIEQIDFEKADVNLDPECSIAIKEKTALTGYPFTEAFTGPANIPGRSMEGFLNTAANSIAAGSGRKFPVAEKELASLGGIPAKSVCITGKINKASAVTGGVKTHVLPRPEEIDGITRVDENRLNDPSCLIYLPYPFIADENAAFSPHASSYMASMLIRTGRPAEIQLAKDILDNFFFEVDNFGYPPETNRGYALTRSQNNIIPTNIWEYFSAMKNYSWLENTGLPYAVRLIEYADTRIGVVALNSDAENDDEDEIEGNRYFTHGVGPRFEVWKDGDSYNPYYFELLYKLVQLALKADPDRAFYAKGFDYNRIIYVASAGDIKKWNGENSLKPADLGGASPVLQKAANAKTYVLNDDSNGRPVIELNGNLFTFTQRFFSNDRMIPTSAYRTFLYGPYGAFIDEFIDASLNAELFRAKKDIGKMFGALADYYGKIDEKKAKTYREKVDLYEANAAEQKDALFQYMYDAASGMFFDYSYQTHTLRTDYPFAGGAYTIWSGLFDTSKDDEKEKLVRLLDYISQNLEGPDGYYASAFDSGAAWDKPNVQPLQQGLIVSGFRDYAEQFAKMGDAGKITADRLAYAADRISLKYIYSALRMWSKGEKSGSIDPVSAATIRTLYDGLPPEAKTVLRLFQ